MEEKKVENLKKEIKNLESNIENIQSNCTHQKTKIVFNQELKQVVKVCETCEKNTGFPTNDELIENGFK